MERRKAEDALCQRLSRFASIYALQNVADSVPPSSVRMLPVNDAQWPRAAEFLITHAVVIVVKGAATMSPGLTAELDMVKAKGLESRTAMWQTDPSTPAQGIRMFREIDLEGDEFHGLRRDEQTQEVT